MTIAALVLAAGMSKRMGAFKPLLPLGGKPMIVHVLETLAAVETIASIAVVTGHEAQRLGEALLDRPVMLIHNAAYASGEMLSSVQAGFAALPAQTEAVVLALGDQPAVRAETVRKLIDVWIETRPPLALPLYRGKRGHPLLISTALRTEILALGAGESLKTVVHRHLQEAVQIEVEDAAVAADVDTPEEYARAQLLVRGG